MSIRLPSFKPRQLAAILRKAGFVETYQDSSHLFCRHPQSGRTTCIPIHSGDVKRGLAQKILFKDCAMSMQEVRRLI